MFKSAGLGIWLFINISVYCFDFFILQRKLRKTDLYNVNSLNDMSWSVHDTWQWYIAWPIHYTWQWHIAWPVQIYMTMTYAMTCIIIHGNDRCHELYIIHDNDIMYSSWHMSLPCIMYSSWHVIVMYSAQVMTCHCHV
jgi:hypothetical protein